MSYASLQANEYDKKVGSANAELDRKKVVQALDSRNSSERDPETTAILADPLQISTAAALAAFCGTFFVTKSEFLSALALIAVFFAGFRDPGEEEGALGSFSRLLGRATIKTVESSKPRLQRIARAAIADEDEISKYKPQINRLHESDPTLARYIQQLEEDNRSLYYWKEKRMLVDEYLPYYSHDDLKKKARKGGIPIKGTKAELLMRLVEADIMLLK
eukprot:CAMPEP_0195519970 /NCGR_PEP_ID=MMETSP0794_2-20130614/15858_1 /TAXON_ID=515487 /ORGANISM="Stephanopyxis turris, Strain CCMP 815" /LENGTH=217 /DNA_ID=CAMNT_0040649229 /DNA_START=224 /DNA_END=877 /DNA_ORIENTATION=-